MIGNNIVRLTFHTYTYIFIYCAVLRVLHRRKNYSSTSYMHDNNKLVGIYICMYVAIRIIK